MTDPFGKEVPLVAYKMRATITSIEADIQGPAIIETSRGKFQTQRGITRLARHQLLQTAREFEKSGSPCELRYAPQAGSNHTLLSITEVSG